MRGLRRIFILLCCLLIIILLYLLHKQIGQHEIIGNNSGLASSSRPILHIACVACGQKLHETLIMLKSALLFQFGGASREPKNFIRFVIFAEQHLIAGFREKLEDWHNILPTQFDYELLPLRFPNDTNNVWRSLFKPCAAQRLFLPSLLINIDALLYVDTDIVFLSPVDDIWRYFNQFNDSQIAALTPEHEDESIGWYNRFARHPYFGRLGVNSGVMLMNLTRMRQFKWEQHVVPIHNEYKLRITWGDQDIINILFYYHPEKLFIMPCQYNYRPDHCMYASVCNASVDGIKILHGNRGIFHSKKQPLFHAVYEAIESYQLAKSNGYSSFLMPLQNALDESDVVNSSCGKMAKEILMVSKQLFLNEYTYDTYAT